VSPERAYDDQLPPGVVKRGIGLAQVPIGAEVVYGAFWYQGWGAETHLFRFMKLGPGHTRPDVSVWTTCIGTETSDPAEAARPWQGSTPLCNRRRTAK
jgi:hypothetical protein